MLKSEETLHYTEEPNFSSCMRVKRNQELEVEINNFFSSVHVEIISFSPVRSLYLPTPVLLPELPADDGEGGEWHILIDDHSEIAYYK